MNYNRTSYKVWPSPYWEEKKKGGEKMSLFKRRLPVPRALMAQAAADRDKKVRGKFTKVVDGLRKAYDDAAAGRDQLAEAEFALRENPDPAIALLKNQARADLLNAEKAVREAEREALREFPREFSFLQ